MDRCACGQLVIIARNSFFIGDRGKAITTLDSGGENEFQRFFSTGDG